MGSSTQDPVAATTSPLPQSRGGQSRGHLPVLAPSRANSAQGAMAIIRGNKEYFSSCWIHSIISLSWRSIWLLSCYFITRAPWAEVILTQHFSPSNNRFNSCFQRSWPVCHILAMLTHPAKVPLSIWTYITTIMAENLNSDHFPYPS